jgi:uncharacterized membrane protein
VSTARPINGRRRHSASPLQPRRPEAPGAAEPGEARSAEGAALDENVAAIRRWEQALLRHRTAAEWLGDRIIVAAASGPTLVLHAVWFAAWIAINGGWVPALDVFDPFPFPLLTTIVSLEAIFLALFVLASQNRLARQADMRAHLDLQIDLLAEREMTAVLRLLQDVTRHLGVTTSVTTEQIRDLARTTDLEVLTERMDALVQAAAESQDQPDPATATRGGD